jgi:hypothetical protein
MGVMGALTNSATNYLHARRLSAIVRFVVTQFGAYEMIYRLSAALVFVALSLLGGVGFTLLVKYAASTL